MIGVIFGACGVAAAMLAKRSASENRKLLDDIDQRKKEREAAERKRVRK